jgi:hypothetical protein
MQPKPLLNPTTTNISNANRSPFDQLCTIVLLPHMHSPMCEQLVVPTQLSQRQPVIIPEPDCCLWACITALTISIWSVVRYTASRHAAAPASRGAVATDLHNC